eukprot:4544521-Prymnesium_polylepis.1
MAATLHDFGAHEAHSAHKYDDQRPGGANPYLCAVVAKAGSWYDKNALNLGRQLKQVNPGSEVLEAQGRLDVIDARHSSDALVEAYQQLDLVPHSRVVPDGPHVVHESERCPTSIQKLETAEGGGTAADRGEEDEEHHHTHQDRSSGAHVAAAVAARVQLVKEPGVGGSVAQLASRPVVARGAVAIALCTRFSSALAWTPAPIRLASPCLLGCVGVAPMGWRQPQRGERCVHTTAHTANGTAQLAACCWRVHTQPVVVLSTEGALGGAFRRILSDVAFYAVDCTVLCLVLANAARDASFLSFFWLVIAWG